MKSIVLVVAGLAVCSLPLVAGDYLTNEEEALGLRVVFSEPVTITGFGDVFYMVEPTHQASEFIFSGGELEPWTGHWLTWKPASGTIVEHEWLDEIPAVTATAGPASVTSEGRKPDGREYIDLIWWWDWFPLYRLGEEAAIEKLQALEKAGWDGVALAYWVFVDGAYSTDVFRFHSRDPDIGGNARTPSDEELVHWLQLIRTHTDLYVKVKIHPCITNRSRSLNDEYSWWAGNIDPIDVSGFFGNLADALDPVLRICNDYGVHTFIPFVECNILEQYDTEIHAFLDQLDPLFDGWFQIDQATALLLIWNQDAVSRTRALAREGGTFWDWVDEEGKPLIVGVSANDLPLAASEASSKEDMAAAFVELYTPVVQYHRSRFPGHSLVLGEIAVAQNDGASVYGEPPDRFDPYPADYEEMGDVIAAIITGVRELGMDGFSVVFYDFTGLFRHELCYVLPDSVLRFTEELLSHTPTRSHEQPPFPESPPLQPDEPMQLESAGLTAGIDGIWDQAWEQATRFDDPVGDSTQTNGDIEAIRVFNDEVNLYIGIDTVGDPPSADEVDYYVYFLDTKYDVTISHGAVSTHVVRSVTAFEAAFDAGATRSAGVLPFAVGEIVEFVVPLDWLGKPDDLMFQIRIVPKGASVLKMIDETKRMTYSIH